MQLSTFTHRAMRGAGIAIAVCLVASTVAIAGTDFTALEAASRKDDARCQTFPVFSKVEHCCEDAIRARFAVDDRDRGKALIVALRDVFYQPPALLALLPRIFASGMSAEEAIQLTETLCLMTTSH